MKESNCYESILKQEGLKNTKHRSSIFEVLEKNDQPMCAEQIFLKLKEKNISINLSTVYRVLETLVSKGLLVKSSMTGENKALFEISSSEHKHHLICNGCKKMFSLEGCPLEDYEKLLRDRMGFDIIGHKLEIFGYCQNCKEKNGK